MKLPWPFSLTYKIPFDAENINQQNLALLIDKIEYEDGEIDVKNDKLVTFLVPMLRIIRPFNIMNQVDQGRIEINLDQKEIIYQVSLIRFFISHLIGIIIIGYINGPILPTFIMLFTITGWIHAYFQNKKFSETIKRILST